MRSDAATQGWTGPLTGGPSGETASSAAGPAEFPNGTAERLVFRSVRLQAALSICTLVLALAGLGFIAWRAMQHLDTLDRHQTVVVDLQQTGLRLEEMAVQQADKGTAPAATIKALRDDIADIIARDAVLSPEAPQLLASAQAALTGVSARADGTLVTSIEQIRKVLAAEVLAHRSLVAEVRRDLTLEFSVTGLAVILLSGLGLLVFLRMRRRVFGPLGNLEQLIALLAKREYVLAPTQGVDPTIRPLTASYNHLVSRLIELERETARHSETLEQEVRTATEALLEQHRTLAAAERLAATGEMAARIAHELRNPLAGMQMALTNLRTECGDREDVVRRMDLVIDELRRVNGLLNGLLDQSRITPEPETDLDVGAAVDDLLSIVRYRIPKGIALRKDIPDGLVCRLPKDNIRQVLLNLILNSADAIGDRRGEIVVSAAGSGDALELAVRDDGPGFPARLLKDGVGPFRTGRPDGTGLGLAIVSRLVRNLDGWMELQNVEPHGAWVGLTLPCRGPRG